jgi:protein-S-isoprenylcysteine O-methyltransferase Ste14
MTVNDPTTLGKKSRNRLAVRGVASTILILVVMDLVLFLSAGTLAWPAAWIFTGLYGAFLIAFSLHTSFNDPGLLQERGRKAENVKAWDLTIARFYNLLLFAQLIVCGLDTRFGWSSMPLWLQGVGLLGIVLSAAQMWQVVKENTFLSRYARIQDDRGHRVITTGPYERVRHPMYAASLYLFPCIALMLGSFYGLIPGLAITVQYVIRTRLEDQMLLEELPGYREYAQKTRFRLVPGVW